MYNSTTLYHPQKILGKLEGLPFSFSGPIKREKLLYGFESKLLSMNLILSGAIENNSFTYKMDGQTEVGVGLFKTKPYEFSSRTIWKDENNNWQPLSYKEAFFAKSTKKEFELNQFESGIDPLSFLLHLRLIDVENGFQEPVSLLRRTKKKEIYFYKTDKKEEKNNIFSESRSLIRLDWGDLKDKRSLKKNNWCVWLDEETQVLVKIEMEVPLYGLVCMNLKKVELG